MQQSSDWSRYHSMRDLVDYDSRKDIGKMRLVNVSFYDHSGRVPQNAVYVRSAHRNVPSFSFDQLKKVGSVLAEEKIKRMIDNDATVSNNYQRLFSMAVESALESMSADTTLGKFRDKILEDIRIPVEKLFGNLILNNLRNPLNENATFRFSKGDTEGFKYENLSGGEKSAFDLILDIVVKRETYNNTVYCIDEPESHVAMGIQGELLSVLYELVPDNCQLWIATHSIGMMRKAYEMQKENPEEVVFLDFNGLDFDKPQTIKPATMTRKLWEDMHKVILGDLADLVMPDEIYICESDKGFDAKCYNNIFSEIRPDVKFISVGSKKHVERMPSLLASATPRAKIYSLRDRDNMADEEMEEKRANGIKVLTRKCIENYLLDDEVIELCFRKHEFSSSNGELEHVKGIVKKYKDPASAAQDIRTYLVNQFVDARIGDNKDKFLEHLATLIKPGMKVYQELERDIFGDNGTKA